MYLHFSFLFILYCARSKFFFHFALNSELIERKINVCIRVTVIYCVLAAYFVVTAECPLLSLLNY